jgi:hypothetical protein
MKTILIACVLIAACSDSAGMLEPVPPGLRYSSATITVSGTPVALAVNVTAHPHLDVGALLTTTNGTGWPSAALPTRVWVVRRGVAWTATATRDTRALPLPFGSIAVITPLGPSWPVGDSVEVVVQVRDGGGRTQLVRAPSTVIVGQ